MFNWYGFLIGAGMVICIVLAYFISKKRGYYSDLVFDIAIICIPMAIVGARLYYVVFDWIANPDQWDFIRIFKIWEGGLAIYGGLIGAVIGGLIVSALQKRKPAEQRVSFLQMADLAFMLIFLGQAIGRWGNFANQEAFGNLVTNPNLQWFPYAVKIDDMGGQWFQATFFYESMLNLFGFGLLMFLYLGKRKSFDGFITSVYCIVYGIGRFFIEALRSDSLWLIPNVLKVSQVVSVLIVIFGIGFILYHMYKARESNKKPFIFVPETALNSSYLWFEKSIFSKPRPVVVKKDKFKEQEIDADLIDGYNGEDYKDDKYEDIPDIIGGDEVEDKDFDGKSEISNEEILEDEREEK